MRKSQKTHLSALLVDVSFQLAEKGLTEFLAQARKKIKRFSPAACTSEKILLAAQPSAALPPYGCGVPLAGAA